jgi:hypothetical protein
MRIVGTIIASFISYQTKKAITGEQENYPFPKVLGHQVLLSMKVFGYQSFTPRRSKKIGNIFPFLIV